MCDALSGLTEAPGSSKTGLFYVLLLDLRIPGRTIQFYVIVLLFLNGASIITQQTFSGRRTRVANKYFSEDVLSL